MKPFRGQQINKSHPLVRGLVGAWIMNEGNGQSLFDLSGHGYTGSFNGNPTWTAGPKGPMVDFNGTNDYVDFGNIDQLNGVAQFSVSLWSIPHVLTDWAGIFSKYYDGNNLIEIQLSGPGLEGNDDLLILIKNGGGGGARTSQNIITAGALYHICLVYDGSKSTDAEKVKLFLNCNQQSLTIGSSFPTTTSNNAGHVQIGEDGDSDFFNGYIGNVMIWNRAISGREIKQLYFDPYQIFDSPSPAGKFYVAGGTTKYFSANAAGTLSTSASILAVARELSAAANGVLTTSTPALDILILFAAAAAGTLSTSTPALSVLRELTAAANGTLSTSSPIIAILRELSASANGILSTSNPALDIVVLFSAAATGLLTTSTPALDITCNFSAAAAGMLSTSNPELVIFRELTAAATGTLSTSAPILAILRALMAAATGTLTTSDINLLIDVFGIGIIANPSTISATPKRVTTSATPRRRTISTE